jgi:CHASE1-domain containing sensor protein
MQTRLRLQQDPEFRSVWMARINELRAKEGRPPYWNAHENRPYAKDEVALLQRPATTSFEPVSQFRRHEETHPAGHRNEQPNKASDQRFLTFQTVLFGREYAVKIPFNPDARCSHKNWRTGNIGWRNEPALICLDCGAIYLVNEGVWRYIPDATGWIDW